MEITTLKDNTFLNNWLSQIDTKVHNISDKALADALQYLENKGIPGIKDEAYKYINIESILKRHFKTLQYSTPSNTDFQPLKNNTIVLYADNIQTYQLDKSIDIFYQKDIPDKFNLLSKKNNMHEKDFFAALNTAYCSNFIVLHIKESLSSPLNIIHSINNENNFSQNRILLVAEDNTEWTVFEEYQCSELKDPYLYNVLYDIHSGKNTTARWIHFQNAHTAPLYNIHNSAFNLYSGTKLHHHQISLNGALWRNNLNIHIHDKNADAELKGLSIGKQQNIISQYTAVYHHHGYSHSNQLYKNIADDKSTVLFNGFIQVDKDAQKTNAYQSSKNILLNDNATIFAKPQLEIYADDVKCSHGSTTGALNEDALFYLKARGIDKSTAQKLLLKAFYSDIIESIENTDIKEYIQQQITVYER